MTTGESTDKTDNLIVTSDAAFERVTSNEHFEDERDGGFLKQNTSGLVQEVPNISFLDIADTMLESQKTLYNRKNWNIVIGKAGKSIEAQPQDLARLVSDEIEYTSTASTFTIPFDDIEIPSGEDEINIKTFEFEDGGIKVLIPGVYRISYGWHIFPKSGVTAFSIGLFKNNGYITSDDYSDSNGFSGSLSGGRSISIECEKDDVLTLRAYTVGGFATITLNTASSRSTYLEIQYIQQSLNNN